ncbi:PREDICTED: uncharacterized protein LOC108767419 [Trachymyrmex cornetzi]|uniref:uncharacterized protein LOC108767419 n=1 Tax=Trachymyrmex cornetzi TaxID=471704 RepID=UPI00084F4EF4|nr:PREDICTED: uncharacterized protein LOC108767419 [Trachymyrmex cornetzi]
MQKRLVLRIARAYRTVARDALAVLEGIPPLEHDALEESFAKAEATRLRGDVVTPQPANLFREVTRRRGFHEWRDSLRSDPPTKETRTTETILPCLEWAGMGWGGLSFHLTQVFTGHRCFGEYLCRIGKEPTTQCHHCDEPRGTAQHTLEFCPTWAEERGVLRREVEEDLSLTAVVRAMVGREGAWTAVSSFCSSGRKRRREEGRGRREAAPIRRSRRRTAETAAERMKVSGEE